MTLVILILMAGYAYAQSDVGRNATSEQVSCATSTTSISTGNAKRITAVIQSEDTSNPVWVCPKTSCTTSTGIKLAPGTTNGNNFVAFENSEWIGPITCISTGSTVTVNFIEVYR